MSRFTFTERSEGKSLFLALSGTFDEDAQMPDIAVGKFSDIEIDMGNIVSINSIGIREWMKWITPLAEQSSLTFTNCTKAMVLQFNMVEGFLPRGSKVKSFYVPFFCEKCDREAKHLFTVGKEVVVGPGGVEVKFDPKTELKCENKPCEMEMDVTVSKYFQFLNRLS